MISEAAVISKPVSRGDPSPCKPVIILPRRDRSHQLPGASKYSADQSPVRCRGKDDYQQKPPEDYEQTDRMNIAVKCRLKSSIGTTCE